MTNQEALDTLTRAAEAYVAGHYHGDERARLETSIEATTAIDRDGRPLGPRWDIADQFGEVWASNVRGATTVHVWTDKGPEDVTVWIDPDTAKVTRHHVGYH